MDFMEISRKRKTVRKFSQTPVEQEKLEKILEAGRWSPTAVNLQPQRILILNTSESLAKVLLHHDYINQIDTAQFKKR